MSEAVAAIVCSARPHGETGVVVRLLTDHSGLIAVYVAGGRGRLLRPVLVPGNSVAAALVQRAGSAMSSARIELVRSRAGWLGEPLPAAAIVWATTLTAAALPEGHGYPALFAALGGLLDAVCHAPSARGWLPGLNAFEALLLRELGYGGGDPPPPAADFAGDLARFDSGTGRLERYLLADRHRNVMGARALLRERLGRIG